MNLQNDVDEYRANDRNRLENMRLYYAALSLEDAVEQASKGLFAHGKVDNHQYRIKKKSKIGATIEMKKRISELKACKSFEEIFRITEDVKNSVAGLGDLWSYDTALRIGFNMGILPSQVYVQRGVIDGVKKALGGTRPIGRSVPLSLFPAPFLMLQPYEVENFLCIWGKDKTSYMFDSNSC